MPQSSQQQASTQPSDPSGGPRPNDARTIHLILASLGVTAYQDRVPLQLLDFAYRYTAGVLGDAAHFAAEGYTGGNEAAGSLGTGQTQTGGRSKASKQSNEGDVTLSSLRLATSTRLGYQFGSKLPKASLLEIAEERNRVRLPDVSKTKVFGVRLPEERFMLTGRAWEFGEEIEEVPLDGGLEAVERKGMNGLVLEGEDGDEEMEDGEDKFDDVFGEKTPGEGEGEGDANAAGENENDKMDDG